MSIRDLSINEEVRQEVRDCIAFYDERGYDWTNAVGYITFKYYFGSMDELRRALWGRVNPNPHKREWPSV